MLEEKVVQAKSMGFDEVTYWITLAALRENLSSLFPTRSDTNQAVRPHKMARGLKFRIYNVEELYYQSSKKKGADLCLCFPVYKKQVF